MADIEKVIKGLEIIIWEVDHNSMWLPGDDDIRDAIELLKEQQAVIECLKRKVKQFEYEKSWDECPDRMNGGGWT